MIKWYFYFINNLNTVLTYCEDKKNIQWALNLSKHTLDARDILRVESRRLKSIMINSKLIILILDLSKNSNHVMSVVYIAPPSKCVSATKINVLVSIENFLLYETTPKRIQEIFKRCEFNNYIQSTFWCYLGQADFDLDIHY